MPQYQPVSLGGQTISRCRKLLLISLVIGLWLLWGSASGMCADADPESADRTQSQEESSETDDIFSELSADYSREAKPGVADPLEPWNRLMFQVNDKLYFWVLEPVASGYAAALPRTWRTSFGNAFDNIQTPVRAVNNLLQGKLTQTAQEIGSFVINTAFGFGGLLEPAQGIPALQPAPDPTDTGLTLGTWGLDHGIYLVWPVLGPSSLRDSVGRVGDSFLNPLNYVEPWELSAALSAEERVNSLSLRLGEYEGLKEGALDPYTALKDGYIQYRNKALD